MARWNQDEVPEWLDKMTREIAEFNGETLRVTVLRWAREKAREEHANLARKGREIDAKDTRSSHTVKFVAPTIFEAQKEIREKGYHFTGEEFVAWNGARGWKTRQGPMKDWKAAMVTWESRWKEKQVGVKRPNPFGELPPPMVNAVEIKRRQIAEARREAGLDEEE